MPPISPLPCPRRLALRSLLPLLALGLLSSCSRKEPLAGREPPPSPPVTSPSSAPSSSAAAVVAPSASVGPPATPGAVPTLALERFAPTRSNTLGLHTLENAIVVSEVRRVGKLTDEGVQWLDKKIPEGGAALGEHLIQKVWGKYPDAIDVLYVNAQGRAPEPTYFPLTGKGASHTVGGGGTLGSIIGVAPIGETTLLAASSPETGTEIVLVRPPGLFRKMTSPAEAGCKEGEIWQGYGVAETAAIKPWAFASTRDGWLVSVGRLCEKRAITAEIWEKSPTSRRIDLSPWLKEMQYWPPLLRGSGNELYLFPGGNTPILRFEGGSFTPLPAPARPAKEAFVSLDGRLHVYDGQTLYRLDEGGFRAIAQLAWPHDLHQIAIDGETIWATSAGALYRLRPGKSLAYHDGCATPFVFLYDVSRDNPKTFAFPTTRKALATFDGAADLSLLDFEDGGTRRLGLPVASREQGEAVIAHLKATMKNEEPKLLCYEAKDGRKIPIKGK